MWNMRDRTLQNLPRTNNNVEGWHRRLQVDVGAHHPNFWHFLDIIKREESLTHVEITQDQAGVNPPPQRAVYRDVQQSIRNIVQDYHNRDRIAFLRGIAHNFNFWIRNMVLMWHLNDREDPWFWSQFYQSDWNSVTAFLKTREARI